MENPPPYSPYNGENPPQAPPNPGYPPQQPKTHEGAYPPPGPGYPPQGYVQQPAGYSAHTSNNTTVVVQSQPQPQIVTGVIPVVNDQMGLSIFACLCCCWPIGIFAIMKSSEARNRYVAGDYAGAIASAHSARNLAFAAIICGLIIIPLIIVLRVVVFATANNDNYN